MERSQPICAKFTWHNHEEKKFLSASVPQAQRVVLFYAVENREKSEIEMRLPWGIMGNNACVGMLFKI